MQPCAPYGVCGATFQMSSEYSRMVRSDENQPIRAVFSTLARHQEFLSRQRSVGEAFFLILSHECDYPRVGGGFRPDGQ